MRNNKNKGFTLVELLVVIAILAILATVSVVGYTSFIKSAHISNDENIAAQLNQFLAAYQADHTTEHYGKPITEDNIWEITQTILKDSQLDELEPHAKDYGYHYYFKFDGQGGGQYVAADENTLRISAFTRVVRFFVSADTPKSNYAGVFYDEAGNKYFLCDTKGSPIAEAIKGFHTFKDIEGAASAEQFANFKTLVNGLNEELYGSIKTLAASGVFVTKEGNFAFDRNAEHSNLFFHEDATFVGNTIKDAENELPLAADKPLLTVTEATTISIPKGVKLPANSLNVANEGQLATVVINAKSWNEVVDTVDAYFTDAKVVVELNGTKYEIYGNDVCEYTTDDAKGTKVFTLKYNNPVVDFDLEINDENATNYNGDVIDNVTYDKEGYIVYDKINGGIQLQAINEVGKLGSNYSISLSIYTWEISKVVLADGTDVTDDASDYASIDENGLLTLTDEYDFNILYLEVTATARIDKNGILDGNGEKASETFEVHVAAVSSFNVTIKNSTNTWSKALPSPYKVSVVHETVSGTAYTLVNTSAYTNKVGNMTFDEAVTIEYADEDSKNVITIGSNGTITTKAGGVANLTVKIGEYQTYNISITVIDVATDLKVKVKNTGIVYIGSADTIKLGDIFTGTIPTGSNVVVFDGLLTNMDYMNPDLSDVSMLSKNKEATLYVSDSNYVLTDPTDKLGSGKTVSSLDDTLQLAGERLSGDKITIAIFNNGVRVSPNVSVYVADAKNVRTYADLTADTSNVLLADIKMTANGRYKLTGTSSTERATLYGNHFTFDITEGNNRGTTGKRGIITLDNANMQDLRIIGSIYPSVGVTNTEAYGNNAVSAVNSCDITNCYIANCRAALSVGDEDNEVSADNITLNNCIVFGGKYCNIEVRNGTLTMQNKVITINQPHTSDTTVTDASAMTVGMGISFWVEANNGSKIVYNNALVQYNFVSENVIRLLPNVNIKASVSSLNLSVDAEFPTQTIINDVLSQQVVDYIVSTESATCYVCNKTHNVGDRTTVDCCKKGYTGIGGALRHVHIGSSCEQFSGEQVMKPKYGDFIFPTSTATTNRYANMGIVIIKQDMLSTLHGGGVDTDSFSMPNGYNAAYYSFTNEDAMTTAFGTKDVEAKFYMYLPTNANTALDTASANAEYIYSPWTQTVGTTTYNAWTFDASGNIIHN